MTNLCSSEQMAGNEQCGQLVQPSCIKCLPCNVASKQAFNIVNSTPFGVAQVHLPRQCSRRLCSCILDSPTASRVPSGHSEGKDTVALLLRTYQVS